MLYKWFYLLWLIAIVEMLELVVVVWCYPQIHCILKMFLKVELIHNFKPKFLVLHPNKL